MSGLAVVVAVTVGVAMALTPAVAGASADSGGTGSVAAAKKKCKKGKARYRGRCVKRCPSGFRKKRTARGRVCARKPKPKPSPQPGPPTPPAPGGNPAPNPDQVQLTRDDAAGHAAFAAGDLLLERAEFGASGRTATYQRILLYGSSQFRFVIRQWNDVSGEIPDKCSEGNWVFKEGYTYAVQGGGTVVKVGITASGGSGDEVLIFHNADPNAVYLVVNGQAVRFEKNPNMNQGC